MRRLPRHPHFANRKSHFAIHCFLFSLLPLLLSSCSPSFEGIRIRAQSPSISEASRRIGLAFRADDYLLQEGSALGLYHLTTWRELKDVEKGPKETESGEKTEARLLVRIEGRGTDYDIFLDIKLRTARSEYRPEPNHPIVVKWEKVLREIVVVEAREEG